MLSCSHVWSKRSKKNVIISRNVWNNIRLQNKANTRKKKNPNEQLLLLLTYCDCDVITQKKEWKKDTKKETFQHQSKYTTATLLSLLNTISGRIYDFFSCSYWICAVAIDCDEII